MALKPIINSLDEVAEHLRGEYLPDGSGKFYLDVPVAEHPGAQALKKALDSEKEGRRAAKDQLKNYEGVDITRYRELEEQDRKVKEGQLIAAGKIDELVALRTQNMKTDLERKLADVEDQKKGLQGHLDRMLIDNAVQTAGVKYGVRESAFVDVLHRARTTFQTIDGVAVPHRDGKPVYAKNGTDFQSIDEWMGELASAAPHLFGDNSGGGARGSHQQQRGLPQAGQVQLGDRNALLKNLDKIASGEVKVVQGR